METVNRRKFLENMIRSGSGMMVLGGSGSLLTSCIQSKGTKDGVKVFIPMPVQVVIDDVGWWSGIDGSSRQEPYRTGAGRTHVPEDYMAIAELGRRLNIRPQAAFAICEWDKENILGEVPTSTWMGKDWDNSRWVGPWMEEAADIIRDNREYLEITIHAVGHEYWVGGSFTRAEWTDSSGQMRPRDQVELHLEYFGRILDQHKLGPFPKSFVPAAFRHSFGPSTGRDVSLASLLQKWGVDYINTPFSSIYHRERIPHAHFGLDLEVMTVNRGDDEFPWLTFPAAPSKELTGPSCGLHWPNMLHPDPERNSEAVDAWVNYLKPYNEKPDMMLARNSEVMQKQLVHHTLTKAQVLRNSIELDFSETDKLPVQDRWNEFTLKIQTQEPFQFRGEGVSIKSQSLQEGSDHQYVLNLERKEGVPKAMVRIIENGK